MYCPICNAVMTLTKSFLGGWWVKCLNSQCRKTFHMYEVPNDKGKEDGTDN